MFTKPDLFSDDDLATALEVGWGLGVTSLDYAPVGFGSHHWQVSAQGRRWFATVDDLEAKRRTLTEPLDHPRHRLEAALKSARAVGDAGFNFVVPPVVTTGGHVIHPITDRFWLSLYPYIDGRKHSYGSYPDRVERIAVVDVLAMLHASPATCRRCAATDDFEIANRDALSLALDDLATPWDTGPFAEPARQLLAEHNAAVTQVLDHYDQLAVAQRSRPERFVLTHGEPHRANTITTDRGIVLIDWDTTLLAPPERDLWDLFGDDPTIADAYLERTGTTVDADAIEMYRLGWDLAEIAIYVSEVRRPHAETEDTRTAWTNLHGYLDPTRWDRRP